MNELHAISQAIGALQEGQRSADEARRDHSLRMERQFERVAEQFDEINKNMVKMSETIDTKVEKATSKVFHGTVGGAVGSVATFAAQWLTAHFIK